MEIPATRWYPAIEQRRSKRRYSINKPISDSDLYKLKAVCNDFRPFPYARAELITEQCDNVFRGIVGSYGKIKGASAFMAFIGDMTSEFVQEEVGYTGEGIILEATALQLDTCWVGGMFNQRTIASLLKLNKNERVLGVTPIGYAQEHETMEDKFMSGFGSNHKRKPLSNLVIDSKVKEWPDWIKVAISTARLAPSAINRQPWGFMVEPDRITVTIRTSGPEFNISKRLDCGIAMLHLEVAALNCGIKGKWEFLQSPNVASFSVI